LESKFNQKELDSFYSLFDESPAIEIMHIHNNCEFISSYLDVVVQKNFGNLSLKETSSINCNRFRLKSREFEYLVLSDTFNECTNKEKFFEACYHSLENSAFIILLEHKNNNNLKEVLDFFDTTEFRVPNNIDIFENYNLIMAKKLHMWGAGL